MKEKEKQETKVLNYTPHSIRMITSNGVVEIPRHGTVRAGVMRKYLKEITFGGVHIPVNSTTFGNVVGLPKEEKNTIIIVSSITAYSLRGKRDDIFIVDELIRDKGVVVGAKSLAKYDVETTEDE
tara:strand:- start:18 stop:392 length:375 start_codon:yes stop_codon:yes gene_type:complete